MTSYACVDSLWIIRQNGEKTKISHSLIMNNADLFCINQIQCFTAVAIKF